MYDTQDRRVGGRTREGTGGSCHTDCAQKGTGARRTLVRATWKIGKLRHTSLPFPKNGCKWGAKRFRRQPKSPPEWWFGASDKERKKTNHRAPSPLPTRVFFSLFRFVLTEGQAGLGRSYRGNKIKIEVVPSKRFFTGGRKLPTLRKKGRKRREIILLTTAFVVWSAAFDRGWSLSGSVHTHVVH